MTSRTRYLAFAAGQQHGAQVRPRGFKRTPCVRSPIRSQPAEPGGETSDPRTPTKRFRERSNLSHLVERVIQRTAGQASGKYGVSSELTPELFALVDGKAVERVMKTGDQRARTMPDGGSLRVMTWRDNGSAFVAVADPAGDERGIHARAPVPSIRHDQEEGIGLGLYRAATLSSNTAANRRG